MNPIEHMWDELERRVRARPIAPKSKNNLWEILQEEWSNIPAEFCQKLVKSMVERVKDLSKMKGSYTRW
jgi:hypothetical protein